MYHIIIKNHNYCFLSNVTLNVGIEQIFKDNSILHFDRILSICIFIGTVGASIYFS